MSTARPAIRVKSRWFKGDTPKSAEQQAGAMAFIVWRVGRQMLDRLRRAGFDIDAGEPYFAFLREALVFLVAVTDRIAYVRLGPEARAAFTPELVQRLADTLQDNESDLTGVAAADSRARFIDLVNEVQCHYAEFGADIEATAAAGGGFLPDFAFYRYLGHRLEPVLPAKDRRWVVDQIMASEAPDAVDLVAAAMLNLLDPSAAAPRRRATMSGE